MKKDKLSKNNARQLKRDNQGRGEIPTSSSSFSARFRSTSSSSLDSAARARDRRTSSSFDRIRHSKCRSRSSYWRRTSFSRSRTLRNNPVRTNNQNFPGERTPRRICPPTFSSPWRTSATEGRVYHLGLLLWILTPTFFESLLLRFKVLFLCQQRNLGLMFCFGDGWNEGLTSRTHSSTSSAFSVRSISSTARISSLSSIFTSSGVCSSSSDRPLCVKMNWRLGLLAELASFVASTLAMVLESSTFLPGSSIRSVNVLNKRENLVLREILKKSSVR